MLWRCAIGRDFESRGGITTFYLFLFTSFSKSFFIVLLPLIQFNVNFRDYLYMLTIIYESSIFMRDIGRYDFLIFC